jgi:hypothetical protein
MDSREQVERCSVIFATKGNEEPNSNPGPETSLPSYSCLSFFQVTTDAIT